MTRHAGVCGRDAGEGFFCHGDMTVFAADAESAHVVLVTERDRLFSGYTYAGRIACPVHSRGNPGDESENEQNGNDASARNDFRARIEDLTQSTTMAVWLWPMLRTCQRLCRVATTRTIDLVNAEMPGTGKGGEST